MKHIPHSRLLIGCVLSLLLAIPLASMARTSNSSILSDAKNLVTLEGKLEITISEDLDLHTSVSTYALYLKNNKQITLHFDGNGPDYALAGKEVRVTGIRVGNELFAADARLSVVLVDSADGSFAGIASLPNTLGEQKTLVLLVNFQDNTSQPYTLAYANEVAFGVGTSSIHEFMRENSFQQTWLSGETRGWYTLAMGSTTCDGSQIANLANQAATNDGVNLSLFNRFIYVFPRMTTCGWSGMGTVGDLPSKIWVNGKFSNYNTAAHEMGHNFGLYHSHALECGTVAFGPSCTSIDYGDNYDLMGNTTGTHFNAFQKELLGWLNSGSFPPLTVASTSGNYTVSTYELNNSNAKGIKILKRTNPVTGVKTYYYLEYRQSTGFDSVISTFGWASENADKGLLLHRGVEGSVSTSFALDTTPNSSPVYDWYDPAIVPGQNFVDSGIGLTVTTVSTSTTQAVVGVTFGTATCVRDNPEVIITPTTQTGQPGTALTYAVKVINNDSSACTASDFTVTGSLPSGFSQNPATSTVNVAPGAYGTVNVAVTSPGNATLGYYNFTETARHNVDTSLAGNASATYFVDPNMTDTIAPTTAITYPLNGTTVPKGTTVTITATASDNVGVTRVEFRVNGTLKFTDTTSPYSYAWPVPNAPNKTYNLTTKAYDAAGNVGTSPTVTVTSI